MLLFWCNKRLSGRTWKVYAEMISNPFPTSHTWPSSQKQEVKPEKLGASCCRGILLQVAFPEMCQSLGIGHGAGGMDWNCCAYLVVKPEDMCLGDDERGSQLGWISLTLRLFRELFSQPPFLSWGCWNCASENWDQAAGTTKKGQRGTGWAIRLTPTWH